MLNTPKAPDISFIDNPSTANGKYMRVDVEVTAVLESWKQSIFAKNWLNADANLKPYDALDPKDQEKLAAVKSAIQAGTPQALPVLGIGIMDHIEIGSARAIFIYLCALGHKSITVHIPKSNEQDFKEFLSAS